MAKTDKSSRRNGFTVPGGLDEYERFAWNVLLRVAAILLPFSDGGMKFSWDASIKGRWIEFHIDGNIGLVYHHRVSGSLLEISDSAADHRVAYICEAYRELIGEVAE